MDNRLHDFDTNPPGEEFNDPLPFDDTQHSGGFTGCYLIMVAGALIIAAIVIYFFLSLAAGA